MTLANIEANRPDLAEKLKKLKTTDDTEHMNNYLQMLEEDLFEGLGLDVEKMLFAVHSIAKGMKSFGKGVDKDKYWDTELRTILPHKFSNKIQGSQDYHWLKNGSSEQVQKFLKYYTGSPSLEDSMDITLTNSARDHKPYPVLNPGNGSILISPVACSYQGYNDKTEEEFIRGLEVVIK